jgi:membrane-associated protease RseP (regulator of RpoE activity)
VTQVEPAGDRDTEDRATWRETLEADPLGLASHRQWEDDRPRPEGQSARADLIRMAVAIVAVVGLGYAAGYGETVLLVLALIACIVAHEFGHYLAAKRAGVKVTEFFVGFGPRLWSIRRGETEYGVKALPLGGYCRIIGMNNLEEVDPADEARTYRHAPLWRRLSIDLAGSAMHFLIAFVVLFAMFFWTGDNGHYFSPSSVPASNPVVEIDGLVGGPSPAQEAGFHIGDRIVAVDGQRFTSWASVGAYIRAHAGTTLNVTVNRDGHLLQLHPTPVNLDKVKAAGAGAPTGNGPKAPPYGFIGIGISQTVHSGLGASISHAGGAFVQNTAYTFDALGHLVSLKGASSYVHMLTSQKAADSTTNSVRFASPVGVVRLLHQAGQSGLPTVLWLIAVINIFIGIFNLLPIFPLDGGRVVVALYEGARSRRRPYRVDIAKLLPLFYAGLVLILFIGLSSLFLDLRDLIA